MVLRVMTTVIGLLIGILNFLGRSKGQAQVVVMVEVVVEASLMVMVNHACNSCPGPPHHHHKQFIIAINSPIANVIILMTQQPQKSHSPQPQLQIDDCKGLFWLSIILQNSVLILLGFQPRALAQVISGFGRTSII